MRPLTTSALGPSRAVGAAVPRLLLAGPATGRLFEMAGSANVYGTTLSHATPTGAATAGMTEFVAQYRVGDAAITAVPEPSTVALLGVGLLGAGAVAARRRRA